MQEVRHELARSGRSDLDRMLDPRFCGCAALNAGVQKEFGAGDPVAVGAAADCHARPWKIDRDALAQMWADGVLAKDIATRLGVNRTSVTRTVKTLGLSQRKSWHSRGTAPEKPVDVQPTLDTLPAGTSRLDVDVLLTKGRWAALADVATKHGITQVKALQVWHRVRP